MKNAHIKCQLILLLTFLFVNTNFLTPSSEIKKRPLTVQDMMKFKAIKDTLISEDGKWIVYQVKPDRGNGEVFIYNSVSKKTISFEKGKKPIITKDGNWVAVAIEQDAQELIKETKKNQEKYKPSMALLETITGKVITIEKVKSFVFSEDSQWMIYQLYKIKKKDETQNQGEGKKKKEKNENKWVKKTSPLILRRLSSLKEIRLENVLNFSLEPSSRFLAYSTFNPDGKGNGLFVRDLKVKGRVLETSIHTENNGIYTNLTWSRTKSRLAFIFQRNSVVKKRKSETFYSGLWIWDGEKRKSHSAISESKIPKGWIIPTENKLQWTKDGERLFFGFKPYNEYIQTIPGEKEEVNKEVNLFDTKQILQRREVDVWHWKDPRISPHQKKEWENFKKKVYLSVFHFGSKQLISLADKTMPQLIIPENPYVALGYSSLPYLREMTWDGRYRDVYLCNIEIGFKRKILTRYRGRAHLSPLGRFVVYYENKHWYLYNIKKEKTRKLTQKIKTPFYNEDHDYPSKVPGYGIGGWTKEDASVLIYDKYDIWEFFTQSNKFICLTNGQGRKNKTTFRIKKLDPDVTAFKNNEHCLVSAYSDEKKYTAFYEVSIRKAGIKKLIQEDKKYSFLKKAKKANKIIYTRESFNEFPDIWINDLNFNSPPERVSDVNPQKEELLWGTSQLIEWKSLKGIPLQGVVILPENFNPEIKYPVLVYFYRFFSQRLYEFNQVVVNHRPCFPFYTSNGYIIFLPDIRFEIGRPGYSAYECIVPGVEKLIQMGMADPKAIGLHGHSWSGYQTAFVITQTDLFAAAIAGAPVSNMTSAYSGIRWGSGLARQFQYEKSQSRIGKSLVEDPQSYIDNSPVFFADKIKTPLLIQFGDEDGAVPWYQGIELYLSLRRFDKNCIFLQYNGEPHHLKKYANKLDYTIKMKEYLDHYLKGEPAPEWITKGVPFKKKSKSD
jgi:dipeptidyl aminopeptidase/acylaminoacyl peptidase